MFCLLGKLVTAGWPFTVCAKLNKTMPMRQNT